ncbi:MAG: multiheme c-type cytochrome, partial [Pollutimonas bauzanensis]
IANRALQFPVTTNNMKDMIHGIHKGRERVTPFMDARDRTPSAITLLDFRRMDFPGKINNCETCHNAGTYTTVPSSTLASTYESIDFTYDANYGKSTATTKMAKDSYGQANDYDLVTSPIAGACLSCHDSDSAAAHAASQGGTVKQKRSVFAAITVPAKGEGCFTCHGVGRSEDITVKHK